MLIDKLNKLPIPKTKKTFIGYSDITAMNLFLLQKWNWHVIHAPMFIDLLPRHFSYEKFNLLLEILANERDHYTIQGLEPLNTPAQSTKVISGKLTGGNITSVENSLGTSWEIDTKDKILFLEEIDVISCGEYIDFVDAVYRSVYHLYESGKLKAVKAIVFGNFGKTEIKKDMKHYLTEFAKIVDVPVFLTNQFGHGKHNMPLVYNADASIQDNQMNIFLSRLKN